MASMLRCNINPLKPKVLHSKKTKVKYQVQQHMKSKIESKFYKIVSMFYIDI